jgi:hypothetical protein
MNNALHHIYAQDSLEDTCVRSKTIFNSEKYVVVISHYLNNLPQNIQILIDNVNIFRHTLKASSFQMLFNQ